MRVRDNEIGKGDHRHVGAVEAAYSFSSYEKLLTDCRCTCPVYDAVRHACARAGVIDSAAT
jgi:hypothetical protein